MLVALLRGLDRNLGGRAQFYNPLTSFCPSQSDLGSCGYSLTPSLQTDNNNNNGEASRDADAATTFL